MVNSLIDFHTSPNIEVPDLRLDSSYSNGIFQGFLIYGRDLLL